MEALESRYQASLQALKTLKDSLDLLDSAKSEKLYESLRDSVIKRFEYSMDTFWKFCKEYLETKQGVVLEVASPKSIFRACLNAKIMNDEEFKKLIVMSDDRNLT
jgi:nucleotidyltransferase substrate binding protein (TIGR01987 family)